MDAPIFELRAGARGRTVSRLQERLGVTADGVLGPQTLRATGVSERYYLDGQPVSDQRPARRLLAEDLRPFGLDVRLGVDLSGHNEGGRKGLVDFAWLKRAGVSFAWLKLTEATRYQNTEAIRQARAALAVGVLRGGYHFGDPSVDLRGLSLEAIYDDARAEAGHYLAARHATFGADLPELPDVLDLERGVKQRLGRLLAVIAASSAARAAATVRWCLAWLEHVERATGRRPWVYTARWAYDAYLRRAPAELLQALGAYPLWVASYNGGCYPRRMPALWTEAHCHQFSGSGRIAGVDGKVDLNYALLDDLLVAA